jgi:hypothetical protein
VAGAFPYLHQCLRVTQEALACGGECGPRLVADEELAAQQVLERANASADRRLSHVQALGGPQEIAGGHDLQEGLRQVQVHPRAPPSNKNVAVKDEY